mgnify:CR=1 FL=1
MKRESECYARKGWLPSLIKYIIYTTISFNFLLGMSGIFEQNVYALLTVDRSTKVQIKEGDEWRYFKGAPKPPKQWNKGGFDDNSWQIGPSGFGYGQERSGTNLGDMRGNYLTVYVRRDLVVNDPNAVTNMTLSIECDGPFIAYLNGIEIIRNVSGLPGERLDVSGFIHELFPGENILAVEGSNDDINSDGFSFTPEFELTEKLYK